MDSGREDLLGRVGEKLDEKGSVHRPAHQRSDPIQGWLKMDLAQPEQLASWGLFRPHSSPAYWLVSAASAVCSYGTF